MVLCLIQCYFKDNCVCVHITDLPTCVHTSCCHPECITDLHTSCCHPGCITDLHTSCCHPECITDLHTSCCHPECITDLYGCYPTLDCCLLYNLVSEYLKKSCGENVPTSTPSVIRNPVNSEDKNEPVYIFNNLATSSRRQGTRLCSDGQRCVGVGVDECA